MAQKVSAFRNIQFLYAISPSLLNLSSVVEECVHNSVYRHSEMIKVIDCTLHSASVCVCAQCKCVCVCVCVCVQVCQCHFCCTPQCDGT